MQNGIYEEIINNKILNNLDPVAQSIGREKLDSEEAKAYLSQYISETTRKALEYARDSISDSSEYLIKQIALCNDIIELLKKYNLRHNSTDFSVFIVYIKRKSARSISNKY